MMDDCSIFCDKGGSKLCRGEMISQKCVWHTAIDVDDNDDDDDDNDDNDDDDDDCWKQ